MPSTKAVGGGIYSGVFDKDVKVPVKVTRRSSLVPLLPTKTNMNQNQKLQRVVILPQIYQATVLELKWFFQEKVVLMTIVMDLEY
jgi:hypothetical protein